MTRAGGPADKFGNQYESWWTICQVLGVLHGRSDWIRLEPIGQEGQGVEFTLQANGVKTLDQVKSSGSFATWSLSRLLPVLKKASNHLRQGHEVRLVTAVRVDPKVVDLCALARSVTEATDLASGLGEDASLLTRVAEGLDESTAATIDQLSRLSFETHPSASLRRLTLSMLDSAVVDDPSVALHAMHGWLFDQMHRTLYADDIRDGIAELGLTIRPRLGDPDTARALRQTVDSFSSRLEHTHGNHPTVPRAAAAAVTSRLTDSETKIVLIHGAPGCGKSTLLRQVLSADELEHRKSVVVRLDTLDQVALTADRLGAAIGLEGSPATLLGDLCGSEQSILVIDQLDAVSTFSGRLPSTFDSVREIVEMSRAWPAMRIVLAVRTVDYEQDRRFAHLLDRDDCAVVAIEPLSDDEIDVCLRDVGISTAIDDATRDLVRLPLNLGLFIEVNPVLASGDTGQLTTTALLSAVENHRRSNASAVDLVDMWSDVLNLIASRMSDTEELSLPMRSVGDLQPAVARLVSAGLLVTDRDRIAFFHERYFDFVFARSFVDSGADLSIFLNRTGQSIFRRSQVRQILEYLRERSPKRYFGLSRELLESQTVRTHLKQIVLQVLRGGAPKIGDWRTFEPYSTDENFVGAEIRWLLSDHDWFRAADANGDVARLLETRHHIEIASAVIHNLRTAPDRVAELLRPYLAHADAKEWASDLVHRRGLAEALPFASELLSAGLLDLSHDGSLVEPVWFVFYDASEPAIHLEWLRLLLERILTVGRERGGPDPFAKALDGHSGPSDKIEDLATSNPQDYLRAVLPFIAESSRLTSSPPHSGSPGCRWEQYWQSAVIDLDDVLFMGAASALRNTAWTSAEMDSFSQILGGESTAAIDYLFSCALLGQNDSDRAMRWLLERDEHFRLRWRQQTYRVARDLIARHFDSATGSTQAKVLVLIHDEIDPWEKSVHGWKVRGEAEWQLLLPIPESALSLTSKRRRQELIRKFGLTAPKEPSISGGFVGPPISIERSQLMNDGQWLKAMSRYAGDHSFESDDWLKGGARELGQVLRSAAEREPARFHEVLIGLPDTVAVTYREALVDGLAGKIDVTAWASAAQKLVLLAGGRAPRSIAWGAEKFAGPWPDELLDIIAICARDEDPRPGDPPAITMDDASSRRDLVNEGLNCTRGAAGYALTRHMWAPPPNLDPALALVRILADDQSAAVRASICGAIGAYSRINSQEAIDLFVQALARGLEPIATDQGYELLRYAAGHDLDGVVGIVERALVHEDSSVQRSAGLVWAHLDYWDKMPSALASSFSDLKLGARMGVATLWAVDATADRDIAQKILHDPDEKVRAKLTRALRFEEDEVEQEPNPEANAVLAELATVPSTIFSEFVSPLINYLINAPGTLPVITTVLVNRILEVTRDPSKQVPAGLLAEAVVRLLREGWDSESHLDHLDSLIEQRVPMWRAILD